MPTRNTRDASHQARPENRGGQRQGRGFAGIEDDEQGKIARTGGEAVSSDAPPDTGTHGTRKERPATPKSGEDPAWLSADSNRDEQDEHSGKTPDPRRPARRR